MILVSSVVKVLRKHGWHPFMGTLVTPAQIGSREAVTHSWWAADNGAFVGFNEDKWRRMLRRIEGWPNCLFVVAPDVVGNWVETLSEFKRWCGLLEDFPVAFVAQDGQPNTHVPWNSIQALFIGGSTDYKLSGAVFRLTEEALSRGKWVHMGRVNTPTRLRYAYAMGCHSVDGTGFSWFPDSTLVPALKKLEEWEGVTCADCASLGRNRFNPLPVALAEKWNANDGREYPLWRTTQPARVAARRAHLDAPGGDGTGCEYRRDEPRLFPDDW